MKEARGRINQLLRSLDEPITTYRHVNTIDIPLLYMNIGQRMVIMRRNVYSGAYYFADLAGWQGILSLGPLEQSLYTLTSAPTISRV